MRKHSFRRLALVLLLTACLLLSSCAPAVRSALPETTLVPGTDAQLPDAVDSSPVRVRGAATLYYRYLDEPYLAPETRVISQTPSQSWEMALLTELLSGPGTQSSQLTAVFPPGTRVLSCSLEGRTLFVTLSQEALNALADEPVDWQEYDSWRVEAPLRRRLCMQSLTATVTENCDADEVQVLIGAEAISGERLRQNYFLDDSEDEVLSPALTRDESLLLTPANTLEAVLSMWISRDWQRLYRYLAATDASTGTARPAFTDFVFRMESLPALNRCQVSRASVSLSGDTATLSLTAEWTDRRGRLRTSENRILHLRRTNDLWTISLEQLTGWLGE
ncbi:MAG: GerMN domain-containing protein [Clostridia bacterium]|nr:GerMN domain-containing protein [Clostridia bacterium]